MSKKPMYEIRWHGRGGQGAVTAAKILAEAAFRSGWKGVTSAPSFGAERRGAPITASTRVADAEIRILSQVTTPDVVVVLDDSLIAVGNAAAGVQSGGVMIVNTVKPVAELGVTAGDFTVVTADVTGSAQAAGVVVGGQPMVNTAILGSIAAATGLVTMESVENAVAKAFPPGPAAKNIEAAKLAFECTKA